MALAQNPITLSKQFEIDRETLSRLNILDITLTLDTKLFVDPLLLKESQHSEFNKNAVQQYRTHFETIIKLLIGSKYKGDAAWRAAEKMLAFPEINGTCLGYGGGSIHGSGFGSKLSDRILNVASEIVEIGIDDPDLFIAMSIFESDIGPDRISDMTTNIVIKAISEFNLRILKELGLEGEDFGHGRYLRNPFESKGTPIILLPKDILRDLPIASDWDGIAAAANHNDELRGRVNNQIASIWTVKSKREKGQLKAEALASRDAFNTLLDSIKAVKPSPYDSDNDPSGLVSWAARGEEFTKRFPINLLHWKSGQSVDGFNVVKEIIKQFRHLIEHLGMNKELYQSDGKPRNESSAQHYFFMVAYCYCMANNLDISPEIDTGTGKIDFKFSRGFKERILVEIKLSTNNKTVAGYTKQLEIYKTSQQTMKAFYVVIDVGLMGNKDKKLIETRNQYRANKLPISELEIIDGTIKVSASKRQ